MGNSMQPLLRHLRDSVQLVPTQDLRSGDNQWHIERKLSCAQIVGKVSCFYSGERKLAADSMRMRLYAIWEIVLDIHLVLGTGSEAYQPNTIMSVNDTGAFLWDLLVS